MVSPVTKSSNVKFEEYIPVKIIEEKYQKEYNLDVKRFFTSEKIGIYKCLDTQLRFYYPFTIVGDDKLYEDLQKIDWYYREWKWEHKQAAAFIKNQYTVLEVGCGFGGFIKTLKEKGVSVKGIELNSKAVKVCIEKKLPVTNELLSTHLLKFSDYYDVVCSFQVLEHVNEPGNFIQECIAATKPGGKIIFAVPNNNPYVYKRDKYHTLNMPPHHMGLWSKEVFANLPDFFPIKIVAIEVEEYVDRRYYVTSFLNYYKLGFLKNIAGKIPMRLLNLIARLRKWQGINIIAIYEKL